MARSRLGYVLIGLVIIVALSLALAAPAPQDEGQVTQIGAIVPVSGDLSSLGEDILVASRFALDEFNSYLEEEGRPWRLEMTVEDSTTRPVTALEKMTSLKARGIDLVFGPLSSAEIRHVKGYADSNDMVIVSCCSNDPSLAIPGDGIFRMNLDHSHLGPALARLMAHEGIKAVIPVWRGDTWGDGLRETVAGSFEDLGGRVDEGIRYVPDTPDFSASVSILAERVGLLADDVGLDAVAVIFLGFDEVTLFFQTASDYELLNETRWFGTNANAGRSSLLDDRVASEFAHSVRFTALQIAAGDNPVYESIRDHALEKLGRTPPAYVYSAYDSIWVLGLAIESAGVDPGQVKAAIPRVADSYVGALGDIKLNEAGDLAGADYEVMSIRDGAWTMIGTYAEGGSVMIDSQTADPSKSRS